MSRAAGPGCCHRALRRVAPRSPAEDRCRLVSSLVGWSGAPSIRRRFRLGNRSRMRCPASDRAGVGGGGHQHLLAATVCVFVVRWTMARQTPLSLSLGTWAPGQVAPRCWLLLLLPGTGYQHPRAPFGTVLILVVMTVYSTHFIIPHFYPKTTPGPRVSLSLFSPLSRPSLFPTSSLLPHPNTPTFPILLSPCSISGSLPLLVAVVVATVHQHQTP